MFAPGVTAAIEWDENTCRSSASSPLASSPAGMVADCSVPGRRTSGGGPGVLRCLDHNDSEDRQPSGLNFTGNCGRRRSPMLSVPRLPSCHALRALDDPTMPAISQKISPPAPCFYVRGFLRTRRGRIGHPSFRCCCVFATGPRPYKDLRQDYFERRTMTAGPARDQTTHTGPGLRTGRFVRGWADRRWAETGRVHARGSRSLSLPWTRIGHPEGHPEGPKRPG